MAITPATFTPDNVTMVSQLEGKVPVEYGAAIQQDIMRNSLVMQLAKYEEMTASEKEFQVMLGGLSAYWVGEGERIQTTKPTLATARMVAKKVATIVPVSREYLHYIQKDFWEVVQPLAAEALYKKIDQAAILGIDNPFAWSVDKSATDAGNAVEGDLTTENVDALFTGLNDEGYEPNAVISQVKNRSLLKGLVRDENGLRTKLYEGNELDGVGVFDVHRDIGMAKGSVYAGDFNRAFYGIPYGIEYKISTDATLTTIQDANGNPVNLFETDQVAMRVIMDVAFMIIDDNAFASLKAPVVPEG